MMLLARFRTFPKPYFLDLFQKDRSLNITLFSEISLNFFTLVGKYEDPGRKSHLFADDSLHTPVIFYA